MKLFGRVELEAFRKDGRLNVVVETPKGSRNKFKYDIESGLFELSGVLPVGASFPFDFGFVPSTLGEDGDPLDVLLLMDEPAFPGCLVEARLIGAIEAEQSEGKGMTRNDRLIAVAEKSLLHEEIERIDELSHYLLEQIEHFFKSYNLSKNKEFKVRGRSGPERANRLVEQGEKRYRESAGNRGANKKAQ
jgi:inorganic pyrophosphatase